MYIRLDILTTLLCCDIHRRFFYGPVQKFDCFFYRQPILSAVQWATNETVAAIWLNRVQNESSFIAYSVIAPYDSYIVSSPSLF